MRASSNQRSLLGKRSQSIRLARSSFVTGETATALSRDGWKGTVRSAQPIEGWQLPNIGGEAGFRDVAPRVMPRHLRDARPKSMSRLAGGVDECSPA